MATVMERLELADMLLFSGTFGFTCSEKKKFPYVKCSDQIPYMMLDILLQEGYSLTSSVLFSDPGKLYYFIFVIVNDVEQSERKENIMEINAWPWPSSMLRRSALEVHSLYLCLEMDSS